MRTPFEVAALYKKETGNVPTEYELTAREGRYGDIIVDGDEARSVGMTGKLKENGGLYYPDPDYIEWLEQKVLSQINNL